MRVSPLLVFLCLLCAGRAQKFSALTCLYLPASLSACLPLSRIHSYTGGSLEAEVPVSEGTCCTSAHGTIYRSSA
ncbi:SPARC-related modular calcium-binding protein 2 isoform X1 [Lates japonicus]|uniref:SPARC-related modular calcium-binding protein 2 isoform X1 n=1 Tax=Lates japonicus TaxID=270547 RepID=A0AAD3NLZ8_LATJO|nr:SPARC-related modular calcium-binding protein 2 isoform X1 [Lates japonicus]